MERENTVPLKARKSCEPVRLKARKVLADSAPAPKRVLAYCMPFKDMLKRDFNLSEKHSIAVNFKLDNNIDLEICVDAPPADTYNETIYDYLHLQKAAYARWGDKFFLGNVMHLVSPSQRAHSQKPAMLHDKVVSSKVAFMWLGDEIEGGQPTISILHASDVFIVDW
jgi:hypothetical protein